jgi:hypothetical protein
MRSVQTQRGRATEFDTFQAGTMTVVLSNLDRRFDPNYAAGPYFGNLLPMKRIRLKGTYAGVTYPIWCGYVDDWPQQYDITGDATVALHCTDGFKVLNNATIPGSYWEWLVRNNTFGAPAGWWRLGEQEGNTLTDSIGTNDGSYIPGTTANTKTGLIAFSNDHAIAFDGVGEYAIFAPPVTTFPYSVGFSFQITGTPKWMYYHSSTGSPSFSIATTGGQIIAQQEADNSNLAQSRTTTATYNDGLTHHLLVVWNSVAAPPSIYIDGVAPASTTVSVGNTVFPNGYVYLAVTPGSVATFAAVTLDELFIYPVDVSAIAPDLYNAAVGTSFTNERAQHSIPIILNMVGWPVADETIDSDITSTGYAWLDAVWPGPHPALGVIQTLADTDNGQFYMGADGTATYRSGNYRYVTTTSNTSQATFGDLPGIELPYSVIATDGGALFLRNRVRVSTSNFSTVEAKDTASIAAYLEWTDDQTLATMSPTVDTLPYRRDLTNWKLAQFKDPIERVTQLQVKPRANPVALVAKTLSLGIDNRITVNRRPQNLGTALSYPVLIEGVNHSIDVYGEWTVDWYLSSADTLPMWVWDDNVYGVCDFGRFGY